MVSTGSSLGLETLLYYFWTGWDFQEGYCTYLMKPVPFKGYPKMSTSPQWDFSFGTAGKLPVNHRQRGCLLATVVRGPVNYLLVEISWQKVFEKKFRMNPIFAHTFGRFNNRKVAWNTVLPFSVNSWTNNMWPSEARPDGSNGHRCRQKRRW